MDDLPSVAEMVLLNSRLGPKICVCLMMPVILMVKIPLAGSGCIMDSISAGILLTIPCNPRSPHSSVSGPPTCESPQVVTSPPPNVRSQSTPL